MDEQTQFYYTMYPHVVDAMRKEGIDTAWASITTPQMMMESNWGRDPLVQYNNFFGMKAGNGQESVSVRTHEGYGKGKQYINDNFLAFPSVEGGVRRGIIRLKDKFHAFEGEPSPEQYIKNINGTPGQIYFTEDPNVYLHNITAIRNGQRANAAIEQYRRDEQQRKQAEVDRYIDTRLAAKPDAVKPLNVYTAPMENIKVRNAGPYKDNYEFTESDERRAAIKKNFEARQLYNKVMNATSIQNNPVPQFQSKFDFSEGGYLQPKDAWDKLSLPEQAAMMEVAVRNGIYNLQDIRKKYNEFAEGGEKEDEKYYSTMEKVAEESYKDWGMSNPDEALLHALNDNAYNYRDFHRKNPQSKANASTHWTDEFKTVYHPTFSNESIYSGQKSQYNPLGLTGGYWVGDTFIPRAWQMLDSNRHSIGGPLVEAAMNEYKSGGGIYIKPSHRGRLTELKKRTGKTEAELYNDGNPAHKKMVVFARSARKWKHGEGGPLVENIFEKAGQMDVSPYRYVQDDEGNWNRVSNDDYGRVFQGLVITPKQTKENFVPVRYDDSLEAAQQRDNYLRYRNQNGTIIGEPGLKIINPEFDILSLSPIIKGVAKTSYQLIKPAVESGALKAKGIVNRSLINTNEIRNSLVKEIEDPSYLNRLQNAGLTPEEINSVIRDRKVALENAKIKFHHNLHAGWYDKANNTAHIGTYGRSKNELIEAIKHELGHYETQELPGLKIVAEHNQKLLPQFNRIFLNNDKALDTYSRWSEAHQRSLAVERWARENYPDKPLNEVYDIIKSKINNGEKLPEDVYNYAYGYDEPRTAKTFLNRAIGLFAPFTGASAALFMDSKN